MAFYVPIGCVRFGRYCGEMYSRHLFPAYIKISNYGERKENYIHHLPTITTEYAFANTCHMHPGGHTVKTRN